MRRRPGPRAAALLLSTTLALAACGSTDESAEVGVDAPITDDSVVDTSLDGPTSTTTTSAPTSDAEPAGSPIPALAPTPDGLAEQLAAAEAAIRDPSSSDAAVTEQANLQQVAYRVVAERPTWQEPVVAALPTALREAARLQLAARAEFRSMNVNPPVELPVWRIVPPAPAEELLGYYQEAEDEFGVEWEYLAAINLVETGMGRIRGDSSAGAQGPMQFIPSTWERFGGGGDVTDPHDAIFGAARYLAHNGGSAADGNIAGALFNYNNDERYVRGVTDYAQIMQGDADTYRGFHQWQVWYASAAGDLVLPEGHHLATPVPAAQYAQDHPDRHRPYSQ